MHVKSMMRCACCTWETANLKKGGNAKRASTTWNSSWLLAWEAGSVTEDCELHSHLRLELCLLNALSCVPLTGCMHMYTGSTPISDILGLMFSSFVNDR